MTAPAATATRRKIEANQNDLALVRTLISRRATRAVSVHQFLLIGLPPLVALAAQILRDQCRPHHGRPRTACAAESRTARRVRPGGPGRAPPARLPCWPAATSPFP